MIAFFIWVFGFGIFLGSIGDAIETSVGHTGWAYTRITGLALLVIGAVIEFLI